MASESRGSGGSGGKKGWGWIWLMLLLAILGMEAASLASPGSGDTLSWWVIHLIGEHPETFGSAVALFLAWLGLHWFIWPLWRRRTNRKGGK